MKQKLNFAIWCRHFSGQSIQIAFSTTKMAPPGGEIKFVFHSLHFLQENYWWVAEVLWWPKKSDQRYSAKFKSRCSTWDAKNFSLKYIYRKFNFGGILPFQVCPTSFSYNPILRLSLWVRHLTWPVPFEEHQFSFLDFWAWTLTTKNYIGVRITHQARNFWLDELSQISPIFSPISRKFGKK